MIMYLVFLIFNYFIYVSPQKAILFSSSIGYYNYRQTSNIFQVYHQLKQYGFQDSDILLMIPENSGCCQKNPIFGSVTFYDHQYKENLNTMDVEIDYDYSEINFQKTFEIFRNKFNLKNDIGKKRIIGKFSQQDADKLEPLFIYITGHGGNTYFKIRERQAIINQHFKILFEDLINQHKFSQILLISDSCSAITPFQTVDAQNFTAFASSSFDEKSKSHGYDSQLNAPKSDDFTFYFVQYLKKNNPLKVNITLKQLYKYMSHQRLQVHSKVVGKGRKYIKNINEFIVKKQQKIEVKQFRLTNLL